jgi:hypothetical protein
MCRFKLDHQPPLKYSTLPKISLKNYSITKKIQNPQIIKAYSLLFYSLLSRSINLTISLPPGVWCGMAGMRGGRVGRGKAGGAVHWRAGRIVTQLRVKINTITSLLDDLYECRLHLAIYAFMALYDDVLLSLYIVNFDYISCRYYLKATEIEMESMRIPWLERKRSLPGDFG